MQQMLPAHLRNVNCWRAVLDLTAYRQITGGNFRSQKPRNGYKLNELGQCLMQAKIIDVEITAKASALKRLGVSRMEFCTALERALEGLAGRPENQLPRAGDIQVSMLGTTRRLGDLATIAVKVSDATSKKPERSGVQERQFREAADLRGKIDEKAHTPMMLLSPGIVPGNPAPLRPELRAC